MSRATRSRRISQEAAVAEVATAPMEPVEPAKSAKRTSRARASRDDVVPASVQADADAISAAAPVLAAVAVVESEDTMMQAAVAPYVDPKLLELPAEINKLKHANETLSASLMQAQADLEAMLATEAASRAVADAARMALESERHDNAIAMRAMQAELASCKAEIASLHSTAKSAASDKEDINEQVNLLNKEIVLLRARVQAFTAENHRLRHDAKKANIPVDTLLALQSQAKQMRAELAGVKGIMSAFGTSLDELSTVAVKRSRNVAEHFAMMAASATARSTHDLRAQLTAMKEQLSSESSNRCDIIAQFRAAYEERKRLHNELQELRGNVRVYCRARPIKSSIANCVTVGRVEDGNPGQIAIRDPKTDKESKFSFDAVFDTDATQQDVFSEVSPLLTSFLDGYNVCIFAYGQTGSGKTYTMEGPPETTSVTSSPGIGMESVDTVFALISQRAEHFEYAVSASYLEIYNESFRDLLAPASADSGKLELRETARGVVIQGLTTVQARTTADVSGIIARGRQNRHLGATDANAHSSRSHSVLTIYLEGYNKVTSEHTRSTLHVIDLAGSERLAHSNAMGERLKEAQYVNKSLSALGQVFMALQNAQAHVPFRNSKLTHFLKDSLGGQSKALMIVCINPAAPFAQESVCSLTFATNVNNVALGRAKRNVVTAASSGSVHSDVDSLLAASSSGSPFANECDDSEAVERFTAAMAPPTPKRPTRAAQHSTTFTAAVPPPIIATSHSLHVSDAAPLMPQPVPAVTRTQSAKSPRAAAKSPMPRQKEPTKSLNTEEEVLLRKMPIRGGHLLARTPVASRAPVQAQAQDRSRSAGASARKTLRFAQENSSTSTAPVSQRAVVKSLAFAEPLSFDAWSSQAKKLPL